MKYEITKEHLDRFEGIVNEDDNESIQECITRALEDFVAGIPEPTVAAVRAPEWIKIGKRTINLRHVVEIVETNLGFTVVMANGDEPSVTREAYLKRDSHIADFLAGMGANCLDLTPKGHA